MKKENKNSQKNYYKITTFILVSLIILFGIIFAFNSYSNYKFEQGINYGQTLTISNLINFVGNEGYVTITTPQGNLTLVPAQNINYMKEKTIVDIMTLIKENGYVNLYNNESEMVLIEYIEEQTTK